MRLAPLAALLLLPLPAAAQEGPRLAFTLGAGVEVAPDYFGSEDSSVGPAFDFDLGYVALGPVRFGDPDLGPASLGWGFRGSFRTIGPRSSDDDPELEGLEDIDRAVEIGGGLRYTQSWWEGFAVVRAGVIGHNGLVADLGVDFIARPSDRLTLRAGPRLFVGSDGYARTYFVVTQAESDASLRPVPHDDGPGHDMAPAHIILEPAFDAFEPEGGILSGGVEVQAEYRLSDLWGLEAGMRWDRLRGDAARSPITAEDDQLTAFVGLTRRFDLRF